MAESFDCDFDDCCSCEDSFDCDTRYDFTNDAQSWTEKVTSRPLGLVWIKVVRKDEDELEVGLKKVGMNFDDASYDGREIEVKLSGDGKLELNEPTQWDGMSLNFDDASYDGKEIEVYIENRDRDLLLICNNQGIAINQKSDCYTFIAKKGLKVVFTRTLRGPFEPLHFCEHLSRDAITTANDWLNSQMEKWIRNLHTKVMCAVERIDIVDYIEMNKN